MQKGGERWHAGFAASHPLFAQLTDHAGLCPAMRPFLDEGQPDWPTLDDYNRLASELALTTTSGLAVRFVVLPPRRRRRRRPSGAAEGGPADQPEPTYAARIMRSGEVATRPRSWHDFFNVLTWPLFPQTKAALYTRYDYIEQLAQGSLAPGTRTREQDRLTMFDEGGVVVARTRPEGAARVLVFGHALFEAIVRGDSPIRAMAWHVLLPETASSQEDGKPDVAKIDEHCAAAILDGSVFTGAKAFPLFEITTAQQATVAQANTAALNQ